MCMAKLNLFSRFINMHAFTVKVFVALFRWILYDLAHTTQWAQTVHLLTIEHALEKYFFEKPSLVWGECLWHFTGMKFHNTTNNNAKGKCTHLQYFVTNAKTICKSLPRLCPNWIILHLPKEEFQRRKYDIEQGIRNGRDFVTRGRQPQMPIYGMPQCREYSRTTKFRFSPNSRQLKETIFFASCLFTRSDWKKGQQLCIWETRVWVSMGVFHVTNAL